MSDERNQGRGMGIMLAAVTGAAVGAGVALLFAPCSGKETRAWLAHRSRELKTKSMSVYAQGKDVIQAKAKELGKGDGDTERPHDRPMYSKPVTSPNR
jgi:gas vesicle protein